MNCKKVVSQRFLTIFIISRTHFDEIQIHPVYVSSVVAEQRLDSIALAHPSSL